MKSKKFKIILIIAVAGLAYLVISAFSALNLAFSPLSDLLTSVLENPETALAPENFWIFAIFVAMSLVWIYILYKLIQSVYLRMRKNITDAETLGKLEKEKKDIEVFKKVAEKDLLTRKISKETYKDIERTAGKKMVEIEAREGEIKPQEREIKPKKPKGTDDKDKS